MFLQFRRRDGWLCLSTRALQYCECIAFHPCTEQRRTDVSVPFFLNRSLATFQTLRFETHPFPRIYFILSVSVRRENCSVFSRHSPRFLRAYHKNVKQKKKIFLPKHWVWKGLRVTYCNISISHAFYMFRLSHIPWFNSNLSNIGWSLQITNPLKTELLLRDTQSVPGGKVSILGGHSIELVPPLCPSWRSVR
jgi:hypothetical protein